MAVAVKPIANRATNHDKNQIDIDSDNNIGNAYDHTNESIVVNVYTTT